MPKRQEISDNEPLELLQSSPFVGSVIKSLRLHKEQTLDGLAKKIGLSKSLLSMVESGQRVLKYRDFRSLLACLDETLSSFWVKTFSAAGGEEFMLKQHLQGMKIPYLLSKEEKEYIQMSLLHRLHRTHDMYELQLQPNKQFPEEYHTIKGELRGYVAGGRLLLEFPKDESRISIGHDFYIASGEEHRFRNVDSKPVTFIVFTKAGVW